jgi:lipopolysaccharide biosynthesis regulator YciM
LPCVEQKLARFAEFEPGNALAVYYHAMAIWKQAGHSPNQEALSRVESMLTQAVSIDPKCSEAYLQLGNLNYSQRNYQKAILQYRTAIKVNSNSSEAHYRLGIAYDRTGDQAMAKQELDLHDKIEKEQAAEVELQRREVKQFRVVEAERPSPSQPH